jgi:hypothetical protein
LGGEKNFVYGTRKFWNENIWKKIIFEIWIKNFCFWFLKKIGLTPRGKWKILKKIDFEIWNKIWKKIGHTIWGNEKMKYAKKFEMKKFEIFHFWNLKWKNLKIFIFEILNENLCLKFQKEIGYITGEKLKRMKWRIISFVPPR